MRLAGPATQRHANTARVGWWVWGVAVRDAHAKPARGPDGSWPLHSLFGYVSRELGDLTCSRPLYWGQSIDRMITAAAAECCKTVHAPAKAALGTGASPAQRFPTSNRPIHRTAGRSRREASITFSTPYPSHAAGFWGSRNDRPANELAIRYQRGALDPRDQQARSKRLAHRRSRRLAHS